jgi:hypothetical protein
MTCCTFVYSVINLTWNNQYVFFIDSTIFSGKVIKDYPYSVEWFYAVGSRLYHHRLDHGIPTRISQCELAIRAWTAARDKHSSLFSLSVSDEEKNV